MPKTLLERFESKLTPEPMSGCWLWTGPVNTGRRGGYGFLKVGHANKKAHRVAWELWVGPIGSSHVLHKCDNPSCVNPSHLWLGSHADNMRDKARKKRQPSMWGEKNPRAKVTAAQVDELRRLYATGQWRQIDLAKRYGLKQPQVSEIVRRVSWASS